jgi:hypothetical protein
MTTYLSFIAATVCARCAGSCASGGSGLPWPTSQNGQRRVHRSPRIMKVAVPLPKHSPMFGQEASSHTVCRAASRRMRFTSPKRAWLLPALTRIQSGFFSGTAAGTTLIGMRAVLASPFCFSLLTFRSAFPVAPAASAGGLPVVRDAEVAQLRDFQAGIAAGIDRRKGREFHVHVERHAMVAAAAFHAQAERGDLGAADIHAGRAGHCARRAGRIGEQIDDRLLDARSPVRAP